MNALLAWLIVATQPAQVSAAVEDPAAQMPGHVLVYRCDFEPEHDRNFDRWPDRWKRRTGTGYPHYVRIEITDDTSYAGKHCLQVVLDGGGAEASTPPVEVDPAYEYVLAAQVRCEGFEHDSAWLSLAFLDADRQLLARHATPPVTGTGPWQSLTLAPVAPPGTQGGFAVLSVHVEPTGSQADLRGRVLIDDVQLIRVPRLQLRSAWPLNVVRPGDTPRVDWQLSGYGGRNPVLIWEVRDALGQPVGPPSRMALDGASPPGTSGEQGPAAGSWAPPDAGPGFYRVRLTLAEGADPTPVVQREIALTVLGPPRGSGRGRGMWTLPQPKALADDDVVHLSQYAALRGVKVPAWLEPNDVRQAEALVALGNRLSALGVELVGIVDVPPPSLGEKWGLPAATLAAVRSHASEHARPGSRPDPPPVLDAVDVFTLAPQQWFPSLEPALTRLGLAIDRWQLGADDDASYGRLAQGQQLAALGALLRRLLRSVNPAAQIGLPWDASRPLPELHGGDGWSFVVLHPSAAPARSGAPCGAEPARRTAPLPSDSPGNALPAEGPLRRWVSVRPLPRSVAGPVQRAADFALQLIEAHAAGADAVVVSHPLDPDYGLLQRDGTPGELFLPWRYLTQALGEARYAGSLHLPGGSQNRVFLRDDEAIVLLWNAQATVESIGLGQHAAQYDLWGRAVHAAPGGSESTFLAGPVPTMIVAADPRIVQLHAATRVTSPPLQAQPGARQPLEVRIPNVFGRPVSAIVRLTLPEGWRCPRPHVQLEAPAGGDLVASFEVRLPLDVETGRQLLALQIEVQAESTYRTVVYQDVQVGQEWLHLELDAELRDTGELVVHQRLAYAEDEPASLLIEVFAPDEARRQLRIRELRRGQYVHDFEFSDGARLRGQTLWVRIEDVAGKRLLNRRLVVPR